MSGEDIHPEHKTWFRLSIENWEWAYNKLRDTVEKNAALFPESVLRNLGDKSVLRNLGDEICRRRRAAALEVEIRVESLAEANDDHKVTDIIDWLTNDVAVSPLVDHRKVENRVESLAEANDHHKITDIIDRLTNDVDVSSLVDRRKGVLIVLAAVGVGLAHKAARAPYLQYIVRRIIHSSTDDDGRVRYYSCVALYNIAKEWREEIIREGIFEEIFEALWKLSTDVDPAVQHGAHVLDCLLQEIVTESDRFRIDDFIPLLMERINAQHPKKRQFLLRWINVLDGVPKFKMLGFLPIFLEWLFDMLCDGNRASRMQASYILTDFLTEFLEHIENSASVEFGRMAATLIQRAGSSHAFTRLNAMIWIKEFLMFGGDQLVPYYADILGVVLPCISDRLEIIQEVARETNGELQSVMAEPSKDFDVGAIVVIARREFWNGHEATKLEALRWIILLLQSHREKVLSSVPDDIYSALSASLYDPSSDVVHLIMVIRTLVQF